MKRGLGLLVMIVSLVGSTACRKAEKRTERQPKVEDIGSAAAAPDPWQQKTAPKDPLKAVFLWSAEKDGKTSYLLGTMHLGVEAETRLPQVVWDKLDRAK